MNVVFEKIVRGDIFCDEFKNLTENNQVEFNSNRIAVLYGPNGTGKTSLAMVLNQEEGAEYSIDVDGNRYTEKEDKIAHVINDQNGRNIIKGNTEDFILGDNIKREYELKGNLEKGFQDLFEQKLIAVLKNQFGTSTKTNPFDAVIKNGTLKAYISDLANAKSKGKSIDRSKFLAFVRELKEVCIPDNDAAKLKYFINDYKEKESIIKKFNAILLQAIKEEKQLEKIEESSDAVKILEKYDYLNDCVVCDSNIEREKLLSRKKEQNKAAFETLSKETKEIIEKIINKINGDDPFKLKESLNSALKSGDASTLNEIRDEIKVYENVYDAMITNLFVNTVAESKLFEIYDEYEKLVKEKPQFESEDIIFIERFLNDCLDRKITLTRDDNNNLKLLLGDKEFLNHGRDSLLLSNGEQNFLSLAFELLKAKKVDEQLVILDDPISSFDSIYKNKIAYSILKILDSKKAIILTHSTDLIKLLEHQKPNCFSLYYLNNTQDEENGLIYINSRELKILIYIHEFLDLLRNDIQAEVIDERSFLISLTPFMRGYCQIINNIPFKESLTKVMHGYGTESVNLTQIYNELFSDKVLKNDYTISAQDIIAMNIDELEILKNDRYPLLSKTLKHTFTYLYLRLSVEKKLVDKFGINTGKHDMLNKIITAAFKGNTESDIHNRVFFLSRKTLLNEFNHFETDMNIFQPAIDITNQALKKEKDEILLKLRAL